MKTLRLIMTLLCLSLSMTLMAQDDLTETITTANGLTVQYPSEYFGEVDTDNTIALINFENQIFIIIGLGDAAVDFSDIEPETSTELKDDFLETLTSFGGDIIDGEAVEEFSINDRPAFLIPFNADFIGIGYVLAFEIAEGTIGTGMMFGAEASAYTPEIVADFKAIANSITIDPNFVPATAISDETTEAAPDSSDATAVLEDDDPSNDSDIPSDAILIEDLPEGMILTNAGLQMPFPEGFQFPPGTEYIENTIGLFSDNFQNSLIVFDDELENYGGMDGINAFLMPTIAAMGGIEEYDADTYLQTMEVDGRTITYLATADFVDSEEEGMGNIYYFIVELLPEGDHIAMVQAILNAESDFDEEDLFELVKAISYTEEEAVTLTINDNATATCFMVGLDVVNVDRTETTVTCPTDCTADYGPVWGTEIYTNDSSICAAAIQMGVIDDMGGAVTVTHVEGQSSYSGSMQNGIMSSDYGEWEASFSVSAPVEEE